MSNTLSLGLPFARVGAGLGHSAATLLAHWRNVRKLRETQHQLARLDDRMLSDIGVSRAQAEFEIVRAMRRPGRV